MTILNIKKWLAKVIADDTSDMQRIRKGAADRFSTDRAVRFMHLESRVDALTDVMSRVNSDVRERIDRETLVVIAGPNFPEALTVAEIADVLPDFDVSECWFYARREDGGGLEAVQADTVDSVWDESFVYFTTSFKIPGVHGRTIGTCSWSKARPA